MSARPTMRIMLTVVLVLMTTTAFARGRGGTRLETRMTAMSASEPLASGKTRFEQQKGRVKFSAEFEALVFTSIVTVEVNGVIVGSAIVDAFGVADLNLDTDLGHAVPVLRVGDRVDVFDSRDVKLLSGRLAFD